MHRQRFIELEILLDEVVGEEEILLTDVVGGEPEKSFTQQIEEYETTLSESKRFQIQVVAEEL